MKTFYLVFPLSLSAPAFRPDRFDYRVDAQASALERAAAHPEHGGYLVAQTIAVVDDPKADKPFVEPDPAGEKPAPDDQASDPNFVRGNVGGQPVSLDHAAQIEAMQASVLAKALAPDRAAAGSP